MKTTDAIDQVARTVGGDQYGIGAVAATSTTATTLVNTGAGFYTTGNGLMGHIVVAGPNASGTGAVVYGVILFNTGTSLTVDYWRSAAAPNSVGSTPNGTCSYCVLPGGAPAWYLGLSANSNAPNSTDFMLSTAAGGSTNAEIWNSGGGLNRTIATYAHTNGTSTYTISNVFTANASDGASNTINKIGIFLHGVPSAAPSSAAYGTTTSGVMLYETAVTSGPTLVSGDQLTLTDTITIS